ncbi:MAG TPA: DUF1772 domain-containing protein [Rhizomicrobium sp.]|jgi:hypothetical protein|nr:DUF1772 domain-containing protein [Rhizomicrobium sp.]
MILLLLSEEARMLPGQLALISAAVFTGAALYVNAVEQPARLLLDNQALLDEWKPAYKRGTLMQAPNAILGFLLGVWAWWETSNLLWIVGALFMLANWPVTYIVIMPVNRKLMSTETPGPESHSLIVKWASLHAIRTSLGFAATVIFLWASLYP